MSASALPGELDLIGRACAATGVPGQGARLLRRHANAVFLLPFAGLVLRLGAPGERSLARACRAVEVTVRALSTRAPGHQALSRLPELGALLTGDPAATGADALIWLSGLRAALEVPGLSSYGASVTDVPELVAGARRASSMKANPIELTDTELAEIVTRAL